MAQQSTGFLHAGVVVFKVLAWVSLVLQVIVGLVVLVSGGEPVPIGGIEVPARLIGVLNCAAGAIYFFLLSLASHVIRVLLDIHTHLDKGSGSA